MSDNGHLKIDVPDEPAWAAGHFPGDPLMPGAKLLDAVVAALQSAGVLMQGPVSVAQTKFTAPVRPGVCIDLSWRVASERIRFECTVAGQAVASGQLAGLTNHE